MIDLYIFIVFVWIFMVAALIILWKEPDDG